MLTNPLHLTRRDYRRRALTALRNRRACLVAGEIRTAAYLAREALGDLAQAKRLRVAL